MAFELSNRSLSRLEGVHPDMVNVVKRAIELTTVDFGVTEGVRTLDTQKQYVAAGKSQTMRSKHLIQDDGYSHAVDLVAYLGSQVCWEASVYDDICDAMAKAAKEMDVDIKWGAAWSQGSIRDYKGSAQDEMNTYIDLRRSEGRTPFLDCPHFELL